ncbi:MAG: menaquinone biosynthesis protein [Desulfobacula sp.]|nr:menaquinone biosynthesis protein [Desulfobacula sp.]
MNESQINMGKISYINASPVFYGLDRGLLPDWLKMIPDVPSVLNQKIMAGEIKISPISAAFYAMNHNDLLLLPDLSISCHGPVLSVLLASHHPIEDLNNKTVVFTPESASSTSFLKMIFNQKKIAPHFEVRPVNNCQTASTNADAVLVIGDIALTQPWNTVFEYCIDLGQLWYKMTQMPFVFAVWVVRRSFAKKYPDRTRKIHELLLTSKSQGYRHLDQIIQAGQKKLNIDASIVTRYFDLLHCNLNNEKVKAMGVFFDSLFDQGVLLDKADIEFFK